ncbi:MAG: hypothetical protein DHS20C12_06880 [Pseudohongiella sp.]|nr:MAG: hypothetical protein DHS20C12_06880 [Pseudohongiella sp.]
MPASRDPSAEQARQLIQLYSQGNLQQALASANQLLSSFPESSFLHNILGATHAGLGQVDAAIDSYRQALRLMPNDAKTHFNLGIALNDKGDLQAAIECYENALKLDSGYVPAYNNLGNALKDEGHLARAIASYKKALEVEPGYAEVHNNLGNALKDSGELEQAIGSYQKALQYLPDYAEAYNNLGGAYKDKADLEQARNCYRQALEIRPDYGDAAWNMVGTAEVIDDAENWANRCLVIDREHVVAKLQLCVINYFKGDSGSFEELTRSDLNDHPVMRSLKWVTEFQELPELYFNRWSLFDSVIASSVQDRPFYEFGVFRGQAFKYLIATFKQGFGFDTFEGLPEDWYAEKAGSYSSAGKIPEIAGGEFVAGKFEDTLPEFFSQPRQVASVINFDADLYSSTLCALNHSKCVMDSQTILVFDELIVNENWEQDEYRALNEFCAANNLTYELLAISFFTKQVAIRLIGI